MSKLNPQNATAYVGPGVLRKGGKITKVPNGPLIKKKGPFKGSTLKSGGKIKKAQNGTSKKESEDTVEFKIGNETYVTKRPKDQGPKYVTNPMPNQGSPNVKTKGNKGIDSLIDRATRGYKTGGTIKKAQTGATMTKRDSTVANIKEQARLRQNLVDFRNKVGSKPLTSELIREKDSLKGLLKDFSTNQRVKATGVSADQLAKNDAKAKEEAAKKKDARVPGLRGIGKDNEGCSGSQRASERRIKKEARRKNGGPIKKAQASTTLDTLYTKKNRIGNVRTNDYVGRMPNGSIEIGKETKTLNNGKTTTSKKATQSGILGMKYTDDEIRKSMNKKKNGGLIKRADGSMSKPGLWDNIRKNKGSGKRPTKQMLVQEKKIKAKK